MSEWIRHKDNNMYPIRHAPVLRQLVSAARKRRLLRVYLASATCALLQMLPAAAAALDESTAAETAGATGARAARDQVSPFPLPEILVTARRIEAPPTLIARQVDVEDIVAWNAHNAGEALTFVPGVNVQTGGTSADARAWVRGFRDRDVLVLFDGIPVASGFEGTIDLNEIALDHVAAINVFKTAPSVIYGTNGTGGVIDIVPQTGQLGRAYSASVETGTDERLLLKANLSGDDGNLGYALSAQRQERDDYSLSDDYTAQPGQRSSQRVNSDYKRTNLLFQADAQDTVIGHSSLFVSLSDAQKGLPVEAGVEDPDYERLTRSNRQTIGLSNHFKMLPLSLKLYYNGYQSRLKSYEDDSFSELDEIQAAEDYSWGAKAYSRLETSDNNSIVLSAGGQTDVFKGEGELERGNKAELATYTLAAENQFWVNQQLSLAAGLIYNYFDQTRLNKTEQALSPQLALAWQVQPSLALHAAAAQRTRFPKLRELYRDRYGNPDLDPQTARNFELGAVYTHSSGLSSDIAVFRSDIDDLIERPDRRSLYENLDRVTIEGVEIASGGWVTQKLFTRVAYTYVDAAEDLAEGGSRQLRSRPTHTASVDLRYRLPHQIELSFNGIYVTGLYDLDPEDVYTELSSYFIANLKLSKVFAQRFVGYVSVSNLEDIDYIQRLGDPREGRALLAGLSYHY